MFPSGGRRRSTPSQIRPAHQQQRGKHCAHGKRRGEGGGPPGDAVHHRGGGGAPADEDHSSAMRRPQQPFFSEHIAFFLESVCGRRGKGAGAGGCAAERNGAGGIAHPASCAARGASAAALCAPLRSPLRSARTSPHRTGGALGAAYRPSPIALATASAPAVEVWSPRARARTSCERRAAASSACRSCSEG